jgi:hypothetical protein
MIKEPLAPSHIKNINGNVRYRICICSDVGTFRYSCTVSEGVFMKFSDNSEVVCKKGKYYGH